LFLIGPEQSDRELGDAILTAIKSCRADVLESEIDRWRRQVLALARVRSWASLEREWDLIGADFDGPELEIAPFKKARRGGYVAEAGDPVYRCQADPKEIGKKLREIARPLEDNR
jgi:hypothetical protein